MFDGMKVVTTRMLGEIDGVPPAWLEPRWSIGQVAARTGVPADTLRYYEHVGAVIQSGCSTTLAIATSGTNAIVQRRNTMLNGLMPATATLPNT